MKVYHVYILLCSDKSYYTGVTNNLERRLIEHRERKSTYTSKRLPIELKWYQGFLEVNQAILFEKKIKGWSRRKKQALTDENWNDLIKFSKNYTENKASRM